MEHNNQETNTSFVRSLSADPIQNNMQNRAILMSHSSNLLTHGARSSSNDGTDQAGFQRRTVESARQLRDNLNNVIRGIRPLVDTARIVNARTMALSSFLNRPQDTEEITVSTSPNTSQDNSFVINLEDPNPSVMYDQNNGDVPNNQENLNNNNNVRQDEGVDITDRTALEAQRSLRPLQKYVPFILILLVKGLYDHHEGILNFGALFVTFAYTNATAKNEATKRSKKSISKLLISLVYIFLCIFLINYIFQDEKLYTSLIFIKTFDKPFTVWDLLWFVCITDFILKLITIAMKILIILMPGRILPYPKRGKIFLFFEATSQLYRSLATLQPWLYYLLDSYVGPEKIVGVFLSAAYMVSKGADIMSRLKLFKRSIIKLLQNVTVGSSPSKEQIEIAGDHCPICHDEYESPVLLQCRHIFCESCVTTWFDREQTCPLCRAKIVDDPSWRDGSTTYFMQLF